MKMMHRRDNFLDTFFERKTIALISLIVISAFALLYTPVRTAITDAIYSMVPKASLPESSRLGILDTMWLSFKEKESLQMENNKLLVDLDRMKAQVLDRNLLLEKVSKLEETLGRAQTDNRVIGFVLKGPGSSPYDTLVVDVGSDNGVSIGDTVVYTGSGAVGEVLEVSAQTAKIKLFSTPGQEFLVFVGPHAVPAKAVGKGLGNFEMKVPRGSAIAIGDNVIIPKGGLLLGNVSTVEEAPALPLTNLFFRTPFNISEIRSVEIIINNH